MTTSNYGGPPQSGEQSTSASGLSEKKEQAQEIAGTATDEAGRVASTAKDEVLNVAAEAKHQAANLMDQALSEVEQQTETQRDRLVETLRGFTDDVEKMLSGQGGANGLAGDLARQAADRARALTSSLQDRRPGEILEDVRGFARRRPTTFLLGALAAGVVAGRVARGAKDSGAVGSNGSSGSTPVSVPTPPAPPATPIPGYSSGASGSGVGTSPANTGVPPLSDPGETPLAPDPLFDVPEPGLAPPPGGQYGGPA